MNTEAIAASLADYRNRGLSVCASSSFQTQSVPLLHLLSRIDAGIPIYFLDTGYLFPETYLFRDRLAAQFGLNVVTLRPVVGKLQQRGADGNLLFTSDPDMCCDINKVQPMSVALARQDVWISGVRADQTAQRGAMQVEQPGPHGTLRFHPLLDWTAADVADYAHRHQLPAHPLDSKGYTSIGCEPCTRPPSASAQDRNGRWYGMQKRECGLHTELIATTATTDGPGFARADIAGLR
jgi:phosphoadenosine phosphosulfate reductase